MLPSRRDLLRIGLGGAGTLLVPAPGLLRAAPPEGEPHFFLMIVLAGGADSSYMFDARPLAMTKAGKVQNYLGKEPFPWQGKNGVTTLASPLVKPLEPFRDRFSVLNGVVMTPSFDGHLQNMNFLFTGNPFGGDSFIPHFNLAETGRAPQSLDAVLMSPSSLDATITNHSGVVPLEPRSASVLSATLRQIAPLEEGNALSDFVRQRMAKNAAGPGRLAAGATQMLAGLDQAPRVHRQLAKLSSPPGDLGPQQQAVALMAECFRLSISRSAIYVLGEYFDVHAADRAKEQPKLFTSAVATIAALLQGLAATPFDERRSMFDVTTVLVASEFGRSLRAPDARIDATGTNHNQFSNSILIGGKGIRAGLVVGASDLADAAETASKAHLGFDRRLEKAMGRPFDFKALRARPDLPATFEMQDHLTVQSVVNTLYALFDVPKQRYRLLRRDLPLAPVLSGLLA
ncbi:MAG TPA: DUF1501 domain-containing protein [Alphaproteobacteria bacterium]|jgi:hypothetical protein